jgi:hypothetical protein
VSSYHGIDAFEHYVALAVLSRKIQKSEKHNTMKNESGFWIKNKKSCLTMCLKNRKVIQMET